MANALSVRSKTGRSPIAEEVWLKEGLRQDLDQPHLLILIHGYQNSQATAERSYRRFRNALPKDAPREFGDPWELHWPGDHPRALISLATYSVREGLAITTGDRLAAFLADQNRKQNVSIIGHSLGCRVALEAMRAIRRERRRGKYHGASVGSLVLLAAAVPVGLCRPDANAGSEFPAPLTGSKEHVFFSRNDLVLRFGFGPGEFLFWAKDSAVGSTGHPDPRWSTRVETDIGHSDYWGSWIVADEIVDLISGSRTRRRAVRPLPGHASRAQTRQLEDRRAPYRLLRTRLW